MFPAWILVNVPVQSRVHNNQGYLPMEWYLCVCLCVCVRERERVRACIAIIMKKNKTLSLSHSLTLSLSLCVSLCLSYTTQHRTVFMHPLPSPSHTYIKQDSLSLSHALSLSLSLFPSLLHTHTLGLCSNIHWPMSSTCLCKSDYKSNK